MIGLSFCPVDPVTVANVPSCVEGPLREDVEEWEGVAKAAAATGDRELIAEVQATLSEYLVAWLGCWTRFVIARRRAGRLGWEAVSPWPKPRKTPRSSVVSS